MLHVALCPYIQHCLLCSLIRGLPGGGGIKYIVSVIMRTNTRTSHPSVEAPQEGGQRYGHSGAYSLISAFEAASIATQILTSCLRSLWPRALRVIERRHTIRLFTLYSVSSGPAEHICNYSHVSS